MMQILDLVLYSKNKSRRILHFNLNSVNIITGDSQTGKSAVGDIISYCLGGSKCDIAEGIIRHSVDWYALRLQFDNTQLLAARKNPEPGQQTCVKCYIEEGDSVEIPEEASFESNTDVSGLESRLNSLLGISENLNIPEPGQTRQPLAANIRHALIYCFLNQTEIATNDFLFHRQQEQFIPQAIKDTMPYFLGAVSEDAIELQNKRRNLIHDIKVEERTLSENDDIFGDGLEIGAKLVGEAKSLHMVEPDVSPDNSDYDSLESVLSPLLAWTPLNPTGESSGQLRSMQENLHNEENELSDIDAELRSARQWVKSTTTYGEEAEHQSRRLKSIGLFENLDFNTGVCPFCSSPLQNPLPGIEAMKQSFVKLDTAISEVEQMRPELAKYISELDSKRNEKLVKIQSLKNQIIGYYDQIEELAKLRDSNAACARLVGRISLWLESVKIDRSLDTTRQKVAELRTQLQYVEEQLDAEAIQERVTSALSRLQTDMTKWAEELNMEHAQCPYRLDYNKLTVVVDAADGPIFLKTMGSASNWLDAHIITYFALQKFLQEKNRPVPAFIFMDQPSQAYFPDETDESHVDWGEIKRLYEFIFDKAESIGSGLQVIVLDHAKYTDDRFRSHVIEDWHGGKKLIPDDWYDREVLMLPDKGGQK